MTEHVIKTERTNPPSPPPKWKLKKGSNVGSPYFTLTADLPNGIPLAIYLQSMAQGFWVFTITLSDCRVASGNGYATPKAAAQGAMQAAAQISQGMTHAIITLATSDWQGPIQPEAIE